LVPDEAAAALGVSRDFFNRHIAHELAMIRRGRRRLVPVRELNRWLRASADLTLEKGLAVEAGDPLWTVTPEDFEEQLEVNGVCFERLGARDLDRLREVYASDSDAQWKLFESIAIAAQSLQVGIRISKRVSPTPAATAVEISLH
jgi:excisionase family DNA binding protein